MVKGCLRVAAVVAPLLTGAACSEKEPLGPYATAEGRHPVQVVFDSDPATWKGDPLVIDSARVTGNVLHVFVTHGGGCRVHEYAAVAWNAWMESYPVQAGLLIAHDAKGDPCRARIHVRLRFDLRPLRRAFARAYGDGSGVMLLQLVEPGEPGRLAARVRYEFD